MGEGSTGLSETGRPNGAQTLAFPLGWGPPLEPIVEPKCRICVPFRMCHLERTTVPKEKSTETCECVEKESLESCDVVESENPRA